MPEWIVPVLGCFGGLAALITALGVLIANSRRNKLDLFDQIQEERDRLDRKLEESDGKHTAMSSRVDSLTGRLNATIAATQVKDVIILIQDNHITVLEDRINRVDPPAPQRPALPVIPVIPPVETA